jgi:dUTP pyrophosphatase
MKRKELKVNIKKLHKDAVIPSYAHETDCGMDLTAVSKSTDEYGNVVYGFGLAFEIPEGYAGFIFPRSSNYRSGLLLTNCVGIIDSCYRGEVMAKFASRYVIARPQRFVDKIKMFFESKKSFKKTSFNDVNTTTCWDKMNYNVGDRVAQMVILPYPKVTFVEKEELSETDRGEGGYGSTGK